MTFYENKNIDEEIRREYAFQSVVGLREAVSIARKAPQPITYENTLDFIHELNPEMYTQITKLLTNKNESETVKYFKDKAEILSTEDKKVSPVEVIEQELIEHQELYDKSGKSTIQKRIFELKAALEYFSPRKISEHKILNQDFYLATHGGRFSEKIYENDNYKDYRLPNSNILRLRLLHPDKDEAILGVDMIYEIFDLEKKRVRFCHLQYKTWNSNVLYLSDTRMFNQIDKMDNYLCNAGYCRDINGEKYSPIYRMPFCCGFLRPTSKLQDKDSKLVSTGIHIPICEVKKMRETENKITKKNILGRAISNKIFEEMFNENLLGSRWLSFDELDSFYGSKGINSLTNSIRIHAQEVNLD